MTNFATFWRGQRELDGMHILVPQDAHRQRTVDWIKAAAGLATAFDVTTKGILHAVFEVRRLDAVLSTHQWQEVNESLLILPHNAGYAVT